jgi:hypothetical protein
MYSFSLIKQMQGTLSEVIKWNDSGSDGSIYNNDNKEAGVA